MLVYQNKLDQMEKEVAMDFSNINEGICWLKLLTKNELVHSEKLVKK